MALRLESYYAKEIAKQKIHIPAVNMLILKLAMKQGCEDYYLSPQSVTEYPRYLFREDINQKWTNHRTIDNLCVMPDTVAVNKGLLDNVSGFKVYNFSSTANLLNGLLEYQNSFFDGYQHSWCTSTYVKDESQRLMFAVAKRIRFFDMVVENDFDYMDMVNVMLDMIKSEKNITPLCAVYHQDEDYNHVHYLYLLDPSLSLKNRDLKKIPHIEQIIKAEYNC